MENADRTSDKKQSSSFSWLEILGYFGAAAAGIGSMCGQVLNSFSLRMQKGILRTPYEEKTAALAREGEKLRHKPGLPAVSEEVRREVHQNIKKIRTEYSKEWRANLKSLGATLGPKGLWYRFEDIDTGDKWKTAALGLTVFSVGIGALIDLRQQHEISKRVARLEEKQQKVNASPSL